MDAVAIANHKFELQRQAFIYAEIKIEMLQAFRNSAQALIFMDDGEGARYVPIDTKVEPIYDDLMGSSFKVGDNFQCKVRENSKERWFQIQYERTFINLRDPERYFKREEDGFEFFIFTALTGISIIMLCPHKLEYPEYKKLLNRVSNSIIGFDKHGSTYVKRGVK